MKKGLFLITGQTGVCKKDFARKLALRVAAANDLPQDPDNAHTKQCIQIHQIEDYLPNLADYLDSYQLTFRRDLWEKALDKISTQLEANPPDYTLLLMHAVHYRNGRVFSEANWDQLAQLHPTMILTLIDDIYDVWERIRLREESFKTRSLFSLEDILLWRTFEIATCSQLANNLYINPSSLGIDFDVAPWNTVNKRSRNAFGSPIPHFVMAAKHPLDTFFRLVFEPSRLRVYASYPISKTRGTLAGREEINRYRAALSETFTVIDPLMIDELRTSKQSDWKAGAVDFAKFPPRWPLSEGPPLGPPVIKETVPRQNPFTKHTAKNRSLSRLTPIELSSLRDAIARQVVDRDLAMVSQAQVVAVYRPFYGKRTEWSGGVGEEIIFSAMSHIPCVVYHPSYDRHPKQKSFFRAHGSGALLTQFETLDEMIVHLKSLQSKDQAFSVQEVTNRARTRH